MKTIRIIDETLRDGEQQPYINFSKENKLELAKMIFGAGVDYITLMPISSEYEFEVAEEISKNGPVLCLTPCIRASITKSLEISKDILLYQAVSDDLITHRHKTKDVKKARMKNLENIMDCVKFANELSARVRFGLEDVSRAKHDYIKEVISAIEPYVSHICIADSVGILNPDKTRDLVKFIKTHTKHPVIIHTHNDLGFADENAIAAVEMGAEYISGTFTGIGERAGNMNLGNVISRLHEKDFKVEIDVEKIDTINKKVFDYACRPPSLPSSESSFWHESGFHAHAFLSKDPMAYCGIDPYPLGFEHKIFFGKKSGIANFKYYLGDTYSDIEYREFLTKIKDLSIKNNRTYTFEEVCQILDVKV